MFVYRYVDYLLHTLRKRELFTWLHIAPKCFWHSLLFRDHYNYFGIKAALPEELSEQLKSQPGALTQVQAVCFPLQETPIAIHIHISV